MLHGETAHLAYEIGESGMMKQPFVVDMGHSANGRGSLLRTVVVELFQGHGHHIDVQEEVVDAAGHFVDVFTIFQSLQIAQSGDGSSRDGGEHLYEAEQRRGGCLDVMEQRERPQMEGCSPVASTGKG